MGRHKRKANRGAGAQRLDRNGIPLLDPPREANKLRRRCHDSQHVWVEVGEKFVGQDYIMDTEYRAREFRCANCLAVRHDHVAIDYNGDRRSLE